MIQFFIGFAGVFILARLSDWIPLGGPACPLAWGAALVAFPALLCGTKLLFPDRRRDSAFLGGALRRAGLAVFLGSYYAVLYPLGWARWTLIDLRWRGEDFISLLFLLLPAAGLALSAAPWAFLIERRKAGLGLGTPGGFARWVFSWSRPLSAPAIVLLAAALGADRFRSVPPLMEALDLYRSLDVLVACGAFVLLFSAAPYLVLLAWPTRPFPAGALRDRFADLAARLGVRLGGIRVWDERSAAVLNACVVGILPRTRQVIFTRGICDRLDPGELAAVFSHEVSHVARRHLTYHFLLAGAFLLTIAPLDHATGIAPGWTAASILAVYALVYWGGFFGAMSRWLELEADLTGAEAIGQDEYLAALRKVESLIGAGAARSGWRHFSLRRRREALEEARADPARREAILRRSRGFRGAVLAMTFFAAGSFAWCAAEELRRPREGLALERAKLAMAEAVEMRDLLAVRSPVDPGPLDWISRGEKDIASEYRGHLSRAVQHLQSAPPESAERGRLLQEAREGLSAPFHKSR